MRLLSLARRFSMEIIALFALTALLLAGLGIYGVISYIVSERTREIGIYFALGAQQGKILKMVLRQGLTLAIAGVCWTGRCADGVALDGRPPLWRPACRSSHIYRRHNRAYDGRVRGVLYSRPACAIRVDPIVALHCE